MAYSMDPRDIQRPAMFPMNAPCRLTTKNAGRLAPAHVHNAYLNTNGEGSTSYVAGHYHSIINSVVGTAPDGHSHSLTGIFCGVGK